MDYSNHSLGALIGSRICHDLISPIGAITNGLELMQLDPSASAGAEMSLISESVDSARARIQFFRIAYGAPSEATIPAGELRATLRDMQTGWRFDLDWQAEGAVTRASARCAFLAIQCFETVLPYGGRVRVARDGDGWLCTAEAAELRDAEPLWAHVLGCADAKAPIAPADVQFALLPVALAEAGRVARLDRADGKLTLSI